MYSFDQEHEKHATLWKRKLELHRTFVDNFSDEKPTKALIGYLGATLAHLNQCFMIWRCTQSLLNFKMLRETYRSNVCRPLKHFHRLDNLGIKTSQCSWPPKVERWAMSSKRTIRSLSTSGKVRNLSIACTRGKWRFYQFYWSLQQAFDKSKAY